jgi:RIO kinase 1
LSSHRHDHEYEEESRYGSRYESPHESRYEASEPEPGSESPERAAFDHFSGEGLVTDLIRPVKSGKEASVFLCRGNVSIAGAGLLALKVYRPRDHRSFKNDQVYKEGRVLKEPRDRNAVRKKTAYGRVFEQAWWTEHEWEVLRALHEAGADVPRPLARTESSILMQYLGDEEAPAPQLRHADLTPQEARTLFDRLMWNVELALRHNWVHADLSAFNVLWWEGEGTIIDLPQAVDPRSNPHASNLLDRDVRNICDHFARFGVRSNAGEISRGLWMGFMFADL